MDTEFLTIRLSSNEARAIERLRRATGLSKTEIVKRALRLLGKDDLPGDAGIGLYALGAGRFGRHGEARRQSADIKRVARARANAKRTGR